MCLVDHFGKYVIFVVPHTDDWPVKFLIIARNVQRDEHQEALAWYFCFERGFLPSNYQQCIFFQVVVKYNCVIITRPLKFSNSFENKQNIA